MTLQDFVRLHPKVLQVDRCGIEGIDLELLHKKIECSKYLKSRQSFVFLLKNYQKICDGYYDDFKLQEEKEPTLKEKALDNIRQKIEALKTVKPKLSDKFNELCRKEYGVTIDECIEELKQAWELKNASVLYDEKSALKRYEKISALVGKYGSI